MSFEEIRDRVDAWRAGGQRHGVAVLTGAWHSAPRRPGARFVRSEAGEIGGNVSAGCVEADLAERLDSVLAGAEPGFVSYGVSDETARGVGLACGGRIDCYLAAREPDDPIWPALTAAVDSRSTVFLLTDVSPGGSGGRWLVDVDGHPLASDTAQAPPRPAIDAARQLLDIGGVRIVDASGDELSGAHAGRSEDEPAPATLVEVLLPARRLIVVGATPVGAALARLARAAGVPVEVIEPRTAYAASLEDEPIELDGAWPDEALPGRAPDRSTAVAIVAHDERIDTAALKAALESAAGYVGLLGGGRTRRRRFEALRDAGIAEAQIERVRAPIGLDIGAERPGEIALAILAEIVAAWRGVG